ncbi:MAG: arsenite methyltransferase [Myxococcales bacterium]|nr:arsenite methyltransferase [Myxococcales bacterium]
MSQNRVEQNPDLNNPDALRAAVAERYAEAVINVNDAAATTQQSCCSVSKLAGYDDAQLDGVPEQAVTSSFGCGNPVAFAGIEPGQTVLDLGSGAGIDLFLAAKAVGPTGRVIGVDMTDEMIARARANIAASGAKNIEVRKGVIEKLPVENGSVDWVISNCVINLSPEKPRVFSEIARVLAPGGQISISDIVVDELPEWAMRSFDLYCACLAGAISERDYLAGLEAAGLEAKVTDRLVYDAPQLAALVQEELGGAEALEKMLADAGVSLTQAAASIQGRVWSARFVGSK